MDNSQNFNSPHNEDLQKRKFFKSQKQKIISLTIAAVLLISVVLGTCVGCFYFGKNASFKEDLTIANEVYNFISKYYYKEISREEFDVYAAAGLSSVMDQYSGISYSSAYPTEQFGISIKSDHYNNHIISGISKSSNPLKPTPAESAVGRYTDGTPGEVKLERGDLLISVDGKSVEGLISDTLTGADFLGKASSKQSVTLVVRKSNGKEATFSLNKTYIATKEASYIDLGEGIGYIKLNSFTGTADKDFEACVQEYKKNNNKKLILDLRDNGGGSTTILSKIASYLIHDSNGNSNGLDIIKLKSERTNQVTTYSAEGNNWLGKDNSEYKLVVLVNENSASASEALLGAIKYYCSEATIIGSPTYGKGIAQQTFELESTDAFLLSMTIGYFYVPVTKNDKKAWETFHGISMLPTTGYSISKFANAYDFTENDFYKEYYNNDITQEKAMLMALSVLNK